MARYIDADKLIQEILIQEIEYDKKNYCNYYFSGKCERDRKLEYAIDRIKKAPTADVKPIVYGEWIDVGLYVYECSNCYNSLEMWWEDKYKFCPNCGATMRKEQENEDSN